MKIRKAEKKDAEAIVRNNIAMAKESEGASLDERLVKKGVAMLLEDETKGYYLLAEKGSRVIGQMMVTFEFSDWRAGNFLWVQSVYTDKANRRKGVYSALYRHLFNEAKREGSGVVGIRLYVDKENHAAMATYEKNGMAKAHYEMYEVDFVLAKKPD